MQKQQRFTRAGARRRKKLGRSHRLTVPITSRAHASCITEMTIRSRMSTTMIRESCGFESPADA
jgi:hypothetical protein